MAKQIMFLFFCILLEQKEVQVQYSRNSCWALRWYFNLEMLVKGKQRVWTMC